VRVPVEMDIPGIETMPFPERIMAQHDLRPVRGDHGSHVVDTCPAEFRADLVAIMIATDQSLGPVETLEDGGRVIEQHIFAGKVAQVPDSVSGAYQGIPSADQILIVSANTGIWPHGHVDNAGVTEMSIANKPVGMIDDDCVGIAHLNPPARPPGRAQLIPPLATSDKLLHKGGSRCIKFWQRWWGR